MRFPKLSVVVISYNMDRELPRTLFSMSGEFQTGLSSDDYEVIVVDNGSVEPPLVESFASLDLNLRIYSNPNPTHSPVSAINLGLNASLGKYIAVFIDGARILSPGIFSSALRALEGGDRRIVGTRGRYLGPNYQRESAKEGYNQATEDALLAIANWRKNGYNLFDVSIFDESAGATWFDSMAESNGLFMCRSLWAELNGFDERFQSRGGGLVNLDMWKRAISLPSVEVFSLMGEATFHQIHGGTATNGDLSTIASFYEEYESIRGTVFFTDPFRPIAVGEFQHDVAPRELVHGYVAPGEKKKTKHQPRPVNYSEPRLWDLRTFRRLRDRWSISTLRHLPRQRNRLLMALRPHKFESQFARMIEESGFFDEAWYLTMYPEVSKLKMKPVYHYLRFGARSLVNPGPQFDGIWYRQTYEDVQGSGINPLVHYIFCGMSEARQRRPLDMTNRVTATDSDHEAAIVRESEFFDPAWLRKTYQVDFGRHDPASWFIRKSRGRALNPGPDFDAQRYLTEHLDVMLAGNNALVHYLTVGRAEKRDAYKINGEKLV